LLLLLAAACRSEPEWYVDRIEGAHAVLVATSGETRTVATQLLPPDAGEGSWIAGRRRDPEAERRAFERVAARRRALAASDDGRPIALGQ
jgi:hypothetical protein